MLTDYEKYRGKCKELAETAVSQKPELILVRGFYHDAFWGKQQHWWTQYPDGTVFDPSKDQFPTKGLGEYEPFDGLCECFECGKKVKEADAKFESNHTFCSTRCLLKCVGLGEFI